jgi:hypothetical protein
MQYVSPLFMRAAGLVLFVVTLLSACTVVVEDDPRGPVGPGPICTREYDPVCARRGGDRQTFANACLADASGYRVVRRGECRRDDDGPRFCTQQYDPVCARRGGERKTFANSCYAERSGYRVISEGECRRRDDDDRACPRIYEPVCARRGGQFRTFPNSCEARASDFRIGSPGPC